MLSEQKLYELGELKKRFRLSDEAVELVKSDWEYGLTSDQTQVYVTSGLKFWQMKRISQCLRNNFDEGIVNMLANGNLSKETTDCVLSLYENNIPMADIEEWVTSSRDTSVLINRLLDYKENMHMDKTNKNEGQKERDFGEELSELKQDMKKLAKASSDRNDLLKQIEAKDAEVMQLEKDKEELEAMLNEAQTSKLMEKAEREKLDVALKGKRAETVELRNRITKLEQQLGECIRSMSVTPPAIPIATDVEPSYVALPTEKNETATELSEQPISPERNPQILPVTYQAMVADSSGQIIGTMAIERARRTTSGVSAIAAALGFKKKSRRDIVQMVTDGKLSKEQLAQIKVAIVKGLSEEQLSQVIHSGASAEQMKEIIEIAESLNVLGYE